MGKDWSQLEGSMIWQDQNHTFLAMSGVNTIRNTPWWHYVVVLRPLKACGGRHCKIQRKPDARPLKIISTCLRFLYLWITKFMVTVNLKWKDNRPGEKHCLKNISTWQKMTFHYIYIKLYGNFIEMFLLNNNNNHLQSEKGVKTFYRHNICTHTYHGKHSRK